MNKIIVLYVLGNTYNPMFKYNSVEEFIEALGTGKHIPKYDDIVVEAYIDDNLVDMGNMFITTLTKLKMVLGI